MNSYIVRYAEIALKGENRTFFEQKLADNIRKQFSGKTIDSIKMPRGRIIVETPDMIDLKYVLGIASYSRALRVRADIDEMKDAILKFTDNIRDSFRISCQRLNKKYHMTSPEIERVLGRFVQEKTGIKVKLKNPKHELFVEIIDDFAFISDEKIRGHSGLPVGVEGEVHALIENNASILAAWLMMKRGCIVHPIAFKKQDLGILQKFSSAKMKLKIIKSLKKYDVLVTGNTIKNFRRLVPVQLSPLIFWKEAQIRKKLHELSS